MGSQGGVEVWACEFGLKLGSQWGDALTFSTGVPGIELSVSRLVSTVMPRFARKRLEDLNG